MMTRDISTIELPPEILEALPPEAITPSPEMLVDIAKVLEGRRTEAVSFRQQSGIEDTWTLCEEAYNGIDDANRAEYNNGKWVKSTSLSGPLTKTTTKTGTTQPRSTAFVRLTSRYVDAGHAKICETLLAIDDRPFSLSPTPIPSLITKLKNTQPVLDPATGQPATRLATKDDMLNQPPSTDGQPGYMPLTHKDLAEQELAFSRECASKAETRIYDWMVQGGHHHEMRKVIFDAARLGVGVLKGPFPDIRRQMSRSVSADGMSTLKINMELVPVDRWVDVWNIFPDPACGENIRNGDYIFEREYFSEKQARNLKGLPGYIDAQLDAAIAMGPSAKKVDSRNPNEVETKTQFEVWYYHGTMKRDEFAQINAKAASDISKQHELVYVIVTMINGIVVRGAINPLESGELPYHSVPWQRRSGFWAGVGVAEQIFVPQRITNASTRALLNNAGISAGPQIIIAKGTVTPADGDWTMTPHKIWQAENDGTIDDVRKAFHCFDITNVGTQLMAIVEYGMRLAEESTSIPLITQGQSGNTTPETLGATQLQNNNANQLLRNIGYSFDGYITEPLVRMYYEYLLLDANVPEEEKGDFAIHAHGSIALVERSIQDQTIAQMMPLAGNPIYGINPKKLFAEFAKSKHLNPIRVQFSDEEQAKIDAQPRPEAPTIVVAKIKAQTAQAQLQADAQRGKEEDALTQQIETIAAQATVAAERMRNETAQLRIRMDTDRDTVFVRSETERVQMEYAAKREELALKKELAIMEYAADHEQSVDQVKAKLADTAMKVRAQKELAAMSLDTDLRKHHTPSADALMKPPVQAPGVAKAGGAFAQV